MKKIFIAFLLLIHETAFGYNVCGPNVAGLAYSYSPGYVGTWAVGNGCDGQTDNPDVATMCTDVVAGGESYCASAIWGSADLDETSTEYGNYCYCRRTKMRVGNELVDSVGQWVLLGLDATACNTKCAMYCAENVSNNIGGMRNAIMLLPAF